MLNSLIVAFTANILVRTGRHIFGQDNQRLRQIGTLFSISGLILLFGAFYLRDCFALILNVIFVWALVRILCSPTVKNLWITIGTALFVTASMEYVRDGLIPMFVVFALLAALAWTRRRRTSVTFLGLIFGGLIVLIVGFQYISTFFGSAWALVERAAAFRRFEAAARTGSLAAKVVYAQPLPIKAITGSMYLLLYPIPLWINFRWGIPGYWWMKGFNGCLMAVIMPLVFVGVGTALKRVVMGGKDAAPTFFLVLYMTVSLVAVAVSTMESRHIGQFLPVMFLLATIPDWRDRHIRRKIVNLGMVWFGMLFMGHVWWWVLKGF